MKHKKTNGLSGNNIFGMNGLALAANPMAANETANGILCANSGNNSNDVASTCNNLGG